MHVGAFLVSGCVHVGGKGGVKVTGTIAMPRSDGSRPCWLDLVRARDNTALKRREVRGTFEEVFAISPSRDRYYFSVNCGEGTPAHQTEAYELQGMKRYHDPIALGTIRLGENKSK